VDYSSITDEFNGKFKTLAVETLLESKRRLCELAGCQDIVFTNLVSTALLPESAGPNVSIAWKGVIEDTLAIINNPRYLLSLIK
jgi:hypothetical protein